MVGTGMTEMGLSLSRGVREMDGSTGDGVSEGAVRTPSGGCGWERRGLVWVVVVAVVAGPAAALAAFAAIEGSVGMTTMDARVARPAAVNVEGGASRGGWGGMRAAPGSAVGDGVRGLAVGSADGAMGGKTAWRASASGRTGCGCCCCK